MKIAVTGATGHVGANLVRALLARGDNVRVLVHKHGKAVEGLDVEVVKGDTRDAEAMERFVAGVEVVFHLAARISIVRGEAKETESVNIGGTRNVLAACKKAAIRRLVHFSSVHALATEPAEQPVDETRPLVTDPASPPYDRSKATAQQEVLRAAAEGLNVVIVQPTAILGPVDFGPSAMGQIFLNLYHRKVPAMVNGGFDWVDVRDVVQGALAAAEKGAAGEAYLLGGSWRPVYEVAREAERVTGKPAPFVVPMWMARMSAPFAELFAKLAGRHPLFTADALHALRIHRQVSHAKATRVLDYHPRPLHETVTDTYKWFDEAKML